MLSVNESQFEKDFERRTRTLATTEREGSAFAFHTVAQNLATILQGGTDITPVGEHKDILPSDKSMAPLMVEKSKEELGRGVKALTELKKKTACERLKAAQDYVNSEEWLAPASKGHGDTPQMVARDTATWLLRDIANNLGRNNSGFHAAGQKAGVSGVLIQ